MGNQWLTSQPVVWFMFSGLKQKHKNGVRTQDIFNTNNFIKQTIVVILQYLWHPKGERGKGIVRNWLVTVPHLMSKGVHASHSWIVLITHYFFIIKKFTFRIVINEKESLRIVFMNDKLKHKSTTSLSSPVVFNPHIGMGRSKSN